MAEAPTELPPVDGTPLREPGDEWIIEILREIKEEALKHFDPRLLIALGKYIYTRHGDTLEGARELIKVLQRALFTHFRAGCGHSRIGQTRGGNPLSAIPTPRNMQ
ncbi:vpr protein [Human immunodeficiency virus 2]|uniref:Protein Vpr n=2 Tax=Human immunodeficiency virus 2 TaxID=11709 RepID=VPR_HV2RO|nr:RecName: Full=Protein Vpr; AltName: Full=R ORF protein; AltName: Full=Viral protein R [Human immunodeficiency virus type 2 (ISOLATE ROD)]AAB00767.1 vpr protein [Human immunodeficiency virus 2]APS24123.1 vpr protein [synthetic HIV-2]AYA94988.1 vpr protein [Human immunodeficiency virus 2]CAA28911.1 r protein [Human immunodeficiency virus 2]prf//1306388E gene R [Human immunodeficiency virus 2]